jgi:hypothetical protein
MSEPAQTGYIAIPGPEVTQMPDGFVVYQPQTEKVHYLNPSAAMIYVLCGTRQTESQLAAYLKDAYDLADPPAEVVSSCLENLVKEGLVEKC